MSARRLEAARAFELEVLRRTSTRAEPFDFGTAYLNEELPRRYSSNVLCVDRASRPPSAESLVREADRILGGAGLSHRAVNADGELGRALAPRFLELGWTVQRLVVMTLERGPDRKASVSVERVGFEEARPTIQAVARRAGYARDEEEVRQLVEHKRFLERSVGASFFMARLDGVPAAVCEMYSDGVTAQIEDVNTLEEHRGRGAATAVVLAAADAARAGGAELVFLIADDEDWPKLLYSRLGFDEAGVAWEFLRLPGDERTAETGPGAGGSGPGSDLPHLR